MCHMSQFVVVGESMVIHWRLEVRHTHRLGHAANQPMAAFHDAAVVKELRTEASARSLIYGCGSSSLHRQVNAVREMRRRQVAAGRRHRQRSQAICIALRGTVNDKNSTPRWYQFTRDFLRGGGMHGRSLEAVGAAAAAQHGAGAGEDTAGVLLNGHDVSAARAQRL